MTDGLFWLLMTTLGLLVGQHAFAVDLAHQLAHSPEGADNDEPTQALDDDEWTACEEHQFAALDLKWSALQNPGNPHEC